MLIIEKNNSCKNKTYCIFEINFSSKVSLGHSPCLELRLGERWGDEELKKSLLCGILVYLGELGQICIKELENFVLIYRCVSQD